MTIHQLQTIRRLLLGILTIIEDELRTRGARCEPRSNALHR